MMRGRCRTVHASPRRASRWCCSARPRSPAAAIRVRTRTCAARYASTEDCVADWGDPKDCEAAASSRRATARAGASTSVRACLRRWTAGGHRRRQPALGSHSIGGRASPAAASARAVTRIRRARPDAARDAHAARRLGGAMREASASRTIRSTARTGTSRAATASPPTRSTRSKPRRRSSTRAASTPPSTSSRAAGWRSSRFPTRGTTASPRRGARGSRRSSAASTSRSTARRAEAPRVQRRHADRAARGVGRPVALDAAGDPARTSLTPTSSIRCTKS